MPKIILNEGEASAREAVLVALMGCRKRVPYLGRVLDSLKLEFQPTMKGIAETDGKVLRVNPERFAQFEPAERVGVIAHEALHVLLRHSERLTPRNGYGDHDRGNAAADYAINGWLLGACFELPEDALYDAQFDGMGAQEIYPRIPSSPPPPPAWGGFAQPGDSPLPGQPDEIPAEAEAAGLGELMRVELGVKPRSSAFSLERILSKLLITEPIWERTYHRANHAIEELPSHMEVDRRPRVVVGLDVSGSINEKVREAFLGVLSKVETPVTVIALDTKIRGTWRNVSRDNFEACCAGMPRTGGGTVFQPAIDFAAQEHASLVYLTDGCCGEHLTARGVHITWLVWGGAPNRPTMEPVGRIIMVEAK